MIERERVIDTSSISVSGLELLVRKNSSSATQRLKPSSSTLQRLLGHLHPHRRLVAWAAFCSVVNKIFDLAPPVLIALAVDVLAASKLDQQQTAWLARLGASDVPSQLMVLAVLSFLVWSAESLFEYLYGVLWRNLAQTTQHSIRLEAYGHLQNLECVLRAREQRQAPDRAE